MEIAFLHKVKNYDFFQADGEKSNSNGKSSSLPASISKIRTSFENTLKPPKLPVGPTRPSPGPILFMVAATAVKVVTRSLSSKEISSIEAAKRTGNVIKYTFIVS